MVDLRQQAQASTSRREFLRDSAATMLTATVAAVQGNFPALFAAAGGDFQSDMGTIRPLVVEVAAREHDRQNSPVFLELPKVWRDQRAFVLKRIDTGKLVDTQVDGDPPPHLVWLISDLLKAGQTRRYRLVPTLPVPPPSPTITCNDGRGLTVKVADRPVLRYNQALIPSPDSQQPSFGRSGYIYPVFNPIGQTVTDDFPPDHMHQHSVWFAWSRATFEGRPANFWELSEKKGTIEHAKLEESGGGTVFAHFTALLRHVDLTAPGGPKPALHETWKLRIYNLTDAFVSDLELTQACATQSPLQVLEHPYGGMAIRGHRNWFDIKNSEYLTSEGKTRKDGNHTRPRWVDLYGWIDGKLTGIALLGHPDNFRFPQPARLHSSKPYFCFAPPVLGPFSIEPGTPYVSRYRLYPHKGRPDPAALNRVWNDYAHPAQARVVQQG